MAELDGEGEVVGGIIVVRSGENAYDVIQSESRRTAQRTRGKACRRASRWCRSTIARRLIQRSDCPTSQEQAASKRGVIGRNCVYPGVLLWHIRSALVVGADAPSGGVDGVSSVMGTAGDSIRQHHVTGRHRHCHGSDGRCGHRHGRKRPPTPRAGCEGSKDHWEIIADAAAREVGPTLFFALLGDYCFLRCRCSPSKPRKGRLFKPLAFTKTYSMAAAALLASHHWFLS